MTKEELAEMLNGREIGNEIAIHEAIEAKAAGLVVVYGASDDLMEFEGAIHDEMGAGDETTAYIVDGDLWQGADCDHDNGRGCRHARAAVKETTERAQPIIARWASEGYCWIYDTDIPHATFDIFEDGERYCRGIVFSLKDVQN